jgi:hypothetical protein
MKMVIIGAKTQVPLEKGTSHLTNHTCKDELTLYKPNMVSESIDVGHPSFISTHQAQ